jgi:hypothetical protein
LRKSPYTGADPDPVLTTREAAARLRVHPITLYKWRQQPDHGGLPYIRITQSSIGYRASDLERFLGERTVGAKAAA